MTDFKKLIAFLKKQYETDDELNRYDKWIDDNEDILNYTRSNSLTYGGPMKMKKIPSSSHRSYLNKDPLSRDDYDVASIINLVNDLDELVKFLKETRKLNHKRMIS